MPTKGFKYNSDVQNLIKILTCREPPPNHVNFETSFLHKLIKNAKRLEVVNRVLHCNFYDQPAKVLFKQIIVPPETTQAVIKTLRGKTKQGHPGANKMLVELRKHYYVPNPTVQDQSNVSKCANFTKAKPANFSALTLPLQKIYDPCNCSEDVLEIDLVREIS